MTPVATTTDALPAAAEGNMLPQKTPEKPAAKHPPPEQPKNKRRNQLLLLGLLIMVVGLVGALAWDFAFQIEEDKTTGRFKGTEHNSVVGITIFIQAMIAFFGILNLEEPHWTKGSPLTTGGMRAAIAGAVVVTYLSLVIFHTMMDFTVGSSPTRDSIIYNFYLTLFSLLL